MRRAPSKTAAKKPASSNVKHNGIASAAVLKRTGKGWNQWFALLDRAGAKKWNHAKIAAHLYEKCKCPGWWNQMVAVGYEQARGLREKHERPEGYSISVSRTVGASLSKLYRAWATPAARKAWLQETKPITVRKATANKSMRVTWCDQKTSLEVNFYAKGMGKSQVVVQHSKLPDAKAGESMKRYWGKTLDGLRAAVEK